MKQDTNNKYAEEKELKERMNINQIIQGDCLEVMKDIPDKSIDMILCDLPYGTTACKWDTIIPFEPLWEQYKRIIKDNGAIVLTGSQPFTSALVMSNIKWFKYEWIWEKAVGSNFATLKYQPMKEHENILVFASGKTKYNPQMQERKGSGNERIKHKYNALESKTGEANGSLKNTERTGQYSSLRNPSSVQYFNNREESRGLHPTQKPVALFEYLIKTYTNEGDTVLDNCAGSFTTAIASENLKRNWICIEKEAEYCEIGRKRIEENRKRLSTLTEPLKELLKTN
jgi:site-specific DNA-methyltransferase (adenine-specific)